MRLLQLKVVLAAVDLDDASVAIVEAARELALAAGAELHVLHASSATDDSAVRPDGEQAVRHIVEKAGAKPSEATLHLLPGDAVHVVRSLADKLRADVIVLGRHRERRAPGLDMGSTALGVVTNSWAPCLVLSRPLRLPLERIVVPVDLSETSRGALVVALSWASALRGAAVSHGSATTESVKLTALFVDRDGPSGSEQHVQALDDTLSVLRREAGSWAGVGINGAVTPNSSPAVAIVDYARAHQAELVVMGTRGRGLDSAPRVGSTSLEVTRRLDIPTLLVPPAVWEAHGGGR